MLKTGLYYVCLILIFLMTIHMAHADEYLVYQYNDNVRIVLSNYECPKQYGGKRAAAQRIDKEYLKGCWINDPKISGNIKIQWIGGDTSTFPVANFHPVIELPEIEVKPQK